MSLSQPAAVTISRGATLTLNVESRTPPLSTLDFTLIRPSGQFMVEEISFGTIATGSGSVDIPLPMDLSLDYYQLQAKSDTTTSPQVETCEGVTSCSVSPTNLVGSVDLQVAN